MSLQLLAQSPSGQSTRFRKSRIDPQQLEAGFFFLFYTLEELAGPCYKAPYRLGVGSARLNSLEKDLSRDWVGADRISQAVPRPGSWKQPNASTVICLGNELVVAQRLSMLFPLCRGEVNIPVCKTGLDVGLITVGTWGRNGITEIDPDPRVA